VFLVGWSVEHLRSMGFNADINTNLIERFHATIKDRVKIMRGLKSRESAKLIMNGWLIHYNFFRPHQSLNNSTPAEKAKIDFAFKNWTNIVKSESMNYK
jgi:putative transposase